LRETERVGFRLDVLTPWEVASTEEVEAIRPHLAGPFKRLTDEQLSWLSFWMVARPVRAH
jgi:hypothetical protein